jgi:superfamily II DNA or RNA helicase
MLPLMKKRKVELIIEIEQYDAHKCRLTNRQQQNIVWKILSWYDAGVDRQKSILKCIGGHGCYFPNGLMSFVFAQLKLLGHTLELTYLDFPKIKHKLIPKLPNIKFEPYQHKILAKVGPRKRGVAVSPTGSGKSVVIGGIVNKLREPETIIVTPTKTIFNQLTSDFHKWFPDKIIGQVGDGKKDMGNITISLFQSLRDLDLKKSKAQLVIVDEAHRISASHIKILSKLRWANYRYGLTATPHERKHFEQWAKMIGCLGPIIYEAKETEVGARVVPVEIHMINFHTSKKHNPYAKCLREDVLFNKTRNGKLLNAADVLSLSKGMSCLFLIDEIEQGKRIVKIADQMGLKHEFAHGNNPKEENEKIKDRLNNGTTKLVIATQVFGLGTNIPNVDCVVLGSVRKSYIDTIQKIGRGRRRVSGKDKLIVIDSIDRVSGRARFCDYFYGYSMERISHYKSKKWEIQRFCSVNIK